EAAAQSVEVGAPPERVWEVISDLPAYTRRNPFIVRAGGEFAVGSRLHVTIAAPGHRPVTFRPRVLEVEPGRSVTWLGRTLLPGLFDGHHTLSVTPTNGGARFRTREEVTGILVPVLGGIMRDSQRGFELMAAAVKARAEGQETA
ncbi:MAG: SRPBCC domain-containing protein, partial [Actinobacteria bacterium]|nr:SRPBCC domain-containing protein [Actinomycetota bacterium]